MRKYLLSLVLILACTAAGAQPSGSWEFNPVNHINVFYNYALGAHIHLASSGWGFDFPLMGVQYSSADEKDLFTLDLVNFSADFSYVKKGCSITPGGMLVHWDSAYGGGKWRIATLGFTVPLGYIHRFNYHWSMGVSVEPGVDMMIIRCSYTSEVARTTETHRPKENGFGFRLDAKVAFWYNDIGLMLRYRPFSCENQGMHHLTGLLSAGITLRY